MSRTKHQLTPRGLRRPVRSLRWLLASCILLSLPAAASAANFSVRDGVIYLEGEIVPGDSDKMVALARPETHNRDELVLDVNSTGGDLRAGMDLAVVVSLNHIAVRVKFGRVCYGSCFSLFVAATRRLISTPARIGVNRPQRNGVEAEAGATSRLLDLYAKLGVPLSIRDKLRTTPIDQIGLLNEDEMRSLGPFEETRFDREDVALKLVLDHLQHRPGTPLPTKDELAGLEQPLLDAMPPLSSQAFWDWYDLRTREISGEAVP